MHHFFFLHHHKAHIIVIMSATVATVSSHVTSCLGSILPELLVGTALAALLFPGFILTLPPLPEDAEHRTMSSRVLFTGRVTYLSVVVHAVIFFVLFGLFLWVSRVARGECGARSTEIRAYRAV